MRNFLQDLRYGMRMMVKRPGFTLIAQPIYAVQGMNVVIENTVRDKSLNTTLLSVFAGVSLLLALIGVYGVMSYTVAQHTREIGIRMALV